MYDDRGQERGGRRSMMMKQEGRAPAGVIRRSRTTKEEGIVIDFCDCMIYRGDHDDNNDICVNH
jgi:hypothetical protein